MNIIAISGSPRKHGNTATLLEHALEGFVGHLFTPPLVLRVTDTYQFDDYAKYKCDCFDGAAKKRRRDEHFPLDCEAARQLGAKLTAPAEG